jgi:hypothetical protein
LQEKKRIMEAKAKSAPYTTIPIKKVIDVGAPNLKDFQHTLVEAEAIKHWDGQRNELEKENQRLQAEKLKEEQKLSKFLQLREARGKDALKKASGHRQATGIEKVRTKAQLDSSMRRKAP